MTTIVVGVTHHASALAACDRAFQLARGADQIHLVNAVDQDSPDMATVQRQAEGLLASLQLSSVKPVTVHVLPGRADRVILEVAERTRADLIVIGNRGMVRAGRFTRQPPARVLRKATCSVLVVDTGSGRPTA